MLFRLFQLLQTTSLGASVLQTAVLRSRVPEVKRLILLLVLCQIMATLLLAVLFYGLYYILQRFAAYDAGTSLILITVLVAALTAIVFYAARRKCCALKRSVEIFDIEKQAVHHVGGIISAFMEGFRAEKSSKE